MEEMKSSHWQYTPNNSPQPLPKSPFVCTNTDLLPFEFKLTDGEEIQIDQFKQEVSQAKLNGTALDEFLAANSAPRPWRQDADFAAWRISEPFSVIEIKIRYNPCNLC